MSTVPRRHESIQVAVWLPGGGYSGAQSASTMDEAQAIAERLAAAEARIGNREIHIISIVRETTVWGENLEPDLTPPN